MSFNAEFKQSLRILESDVFGAGDRTTEYQINFFKITGASAISKTFRSISAGLSNQEITLTPVNTSNPGKSLIIVADQPIDIRLNASNNSMISEVRQLYIYTSNTLSSLFIGVPNSANPANIFIHIVAGGSITTSTPLP